MDYDKILESLETIKDICDRGIETILKNEKNQFSKLKSYMDSITETATDVTLEIYK